MNRVPAGLTAIEIGSLSRPPTYSVVTVLLALIEPLALAATFRMRTPKLGISAMYRLPAASRAIACGATSAGFSDEENVRFVWVEAPGRLVVSATILFLLESATYTVPFDATAIDCELEKPLPMVCCASETTAGAAAKAGDANNIVASAERQQTNCFHCIRREGFDES